MFSKNRKKIEKGGRLDIPGSSIEYKTKTWRAGKIPVRDVEKCVQCLFCYNFCPEVCWKIKNEKIDYVDLEYCKGCGVCAQVCPVKPKVIVMKAD